MRDPKDSGLPGGRAFFQRFTLSFGLTGVGAALIVALFLGALLQLPPDQAAGLRWILVGVVLLATPIGMLVQQRMMAGLVDCLDALAAGTATRLELKSGFAVAVDLPRRCGIFGATNFALGSIALVVAMNIGFAEFRLHSAALIVAAALTGGVLSGLIQFFVTKESLQQVRSVLAEQLDDVDERSRLVHRLPLVRKISVVLTTIALVPVIFSVFLAYSRNSSSAVALMQRMHGALLERAVDEIRREPAGDLDSLIASLQQDVDRWGVPGRVARVELEPGSAQEFPGFLSESERAWLAAQPGDRARGDLEVLRGPDIVSWVREPAAGRVVTLAIATPRASLWNADGLVLLFAAVVGIACIVALVVAWLLARDVGLVASGLQEQSGRLAAGDLRAGEVIESEDELGQLGRSFATMSAALRATVGRVVDTANRIDEAGAQISASAKNATTANRARAESTLGCVRAVAAVSGQAQEIQAASAALNELAERSNSSVLEMDTSGVELRKTAQALCGKVEQVTASMDESLRSLASVRDETAELTLAAEETASSLEETTASLRQVDAAAEQTATLAADVISAAESGQHRVAQTVTSMRSIQQETARAQEVVGRLGDRVSDIGAVVKVVLDIADRTSLLALNAAIIAAQAGDSGRSFGVVADEISQLASGVRSSSEQIAEVVRSVEQESALAVEAIGVGSTSVDHGVRLANEAGASLEVINESAARSAGHSREIVEAVREQVQAAHHVAAMMERVNDGLISIRRATEEQSKGHEAVVVVAHEVSSASQKMRANAIEQTVGLRNVSESAEGVRKASESIHELVESQTEACATSAELLERLAAQTEQSDASVEQVEEAIRELVGDSEVLRADVARFRL